MSLLRRWFDPIRSKLFYNKPSRQEVRSTHQGLSIYLRLDDVYSYLIVQQLTQLNDILSEELKPLKIVISNTKAAPPYHMTEKEWETYCLNDAKILAQHHRFGFDDKPEVPSQETLQQAELILRNTPLQQDDFLHLLEDVFHMLWHQQYGKLRTLYSMMSQKKETVLPEKVFNDTPVSTAYFEFGQRKYNAVDDLLRLTRRLKQQKQLTENPIFLIHHIEWREHALSDAEELAIVHALHAELDLYIALEDPISWLLLAYIKEELADYYNIKLNIFPLSYHGRDDFDWSLATRLSKRTQVAFTPFCRPNEDAVQHIAQLFYSVEEEQRVQAMYTILEEVWSNGKDLSYMPHIQAVQEKLGIQTLTTNIIDNVLEQNDALCTSKHQPNFPVLELRVDGKRYVFNSLYRVWMIESILSNVLEKRAAH